MCGIAYPSVDTRGARLAVSQNRSSYASLDSDPGLDRSCSVFGQATVVHTHSSMRVRHEPPGNISPCPNSPGQLMGMSTLALAAGHRTSCKASIWRFAPRQTLRHLQTRKHGGPQSWRRPSRCLCPPLSTSPPSGNHATTVPSHATDQSIPTDFPAFRCGLGRAERTGAGDIG